MTAALELLAFLLSTALGHLTLRCCVGSQSQSPLFLALAPGLGIGASSLIWFFALAMIPHGPSPIYFAVEILVCAALILFARHRSIATILPARPPNRAFLLTLVIALSSAVYFAKLLHAGPNGGWDAWAIWNLHARSIYQSGKQAWAFVLPQIGFTHADYPALLPISSVRLWTASRSEDTLSPRLLSCVFTFSTALLLFEAICALKGAIAGTLATLTLLASRQFLFAGATQYADVPMGFFILASLALLALHRIESPNNNFLFMAGLCSGLAAWTKNEGLLLFVLTLCIVVAPSEKRKTLWFLAGSVAPICALVLYKLQTPAHSDILGWLASPSGWRRMSEPGRLIEVVTGFAKVLWNFESWKVNAVIVLALYALLCGPDRNRENRDVSLKALSVLTAGVCGYALIILTSTWKIESYIGSTVDRLYVQMWPTLIFCLFLGARTPYPSHEHSNGGRKPFLKNS